jgi:hypothetical protein
MAHKFGSTPPGGGSRSVFSSSSTSSSSTVKPDKNHQNYRKTSDVLRPPRAQPPSTMHARSRADATYTTQEPTPDGPTPAALIAAKYRRDRQSRRSAVASPRTPEGEDILPLLDEKTVIDGLHKLFRIALFTVTEVGPEMLQATEGDLQVAALALGLLWASLRIQAKPPAVVLPLPAAGWDKDFANCFPTGREVRVRRVRGPLLTLETCPVSLKPLFQLWCNIIPRVQALSPPLQSEVARIICDLDPLEFPLIPQVSVVLSHSCDIPTSFGVIAPPLIHPLAGHATGGRFAKCRHRA